MRRIARTAADGVGARVAGNAWGEEAAGDERAWLRGRLRTGNGCGELRGRLRTAADGVGAREWLEMGGEKKQPLVMSELGCADGCGREKGAENCADGCGWRGCNGVAGNYGCGEEAAGDERAWLRGRLRTANGWRELRGRLRTAWVPGSGWKLVGRRSRWRSASLAARTAADGKWVRRIARTAADGVGARGKWVRRRSRWRSASVAARTAADGVGATEWLEMGGEKKPLEISELGCADGCGREMGAENCADGCGRRGCNGVAGNWWREDAAGDERAWLRGGCGRQMGAENCADGCGRRGCKGVAGNGWGKEAAGDERAWLRGRLRTANGWGELRGRLRLAWVPGSGWKWVGRRSRWRSASSAARAAADGKWLRRIARTAADGVGAREWLEMVWEKKPLGMSELGCADGCGRQMGGVNVADGCGRRGCKGVAGNVWGEEAAGDERAWLRGTAADGNWVRRIARMAADGVGAREWLEMGGEKNKMQPTNPNAHTYVNGYAVTQNNFLQ